MRADIIDGLTLRPVEFFDLGLAATVHAGCFREPWAEKAIGELLSMPGGFGILADVTGRPVGIIIALALGTEGEILTLGVLPDFRRRGIARQLLARATSLLLQAGCQRVVLEVAEDNDAARALYQGAGFSQIGRRPAYYRRGRGALEDALILARAIITDPP
jgi:ribosomal-protein-alanine N-acetyltransferase